MGEKGNQSRNRIHQVLCNYRELHTRSRIHPCVALEMTESEAMSESIRRFRTSRTIRVGQGLDALAINLMKNRREDLPGLFQFIRPYELRLIALDHIKEKTFVGFGKTTVLEARGIVQVQLGLLCAQGHARGFHLNLHVGGFVGLNANDQFIACGLFKQLTGHIIELQSHFGLAFIQCFTTLEDERYTRPSFVFYKEDRGSILEREEREGRRS